MKKLYPRPHTVIGDNLRHPIPAGQLHALERRQSLDAQQRAYREPVMKLIQPNPRPRRPA
jgi:hypothetical protein